MDNPSVLAHALMRIDIDKFKGELVPIFLTGNGDTISLRLPSGLVGPLVIGLRSQFKAIATSAEEKVGLSQPLRMLGSRGFQTGDGRTGIMLEIEGFEVSILVTADMLADVRAALDEVEALIRAPTPKPAN